MTAKSLLTILLILTLLISTFELAESHAETEYVIPLEGPTWDHSGISLLVVTQYNETWWNPSYLNSILRSIDQWNAAISYFASNYSDFAYVSSLALHPRVSDSPVNGFDCSISWILQFGNETCDAGLTRTTSSQDLINASTLTLSAQDCQGNVLSEGDMQNVAIHELGHVLGLGHSNYTSDLMYYSYSLGSPIRSISTLDMYGVGLVFRWMASSREYDSSNQGSPIYSATLPSSIAYEGLPIPEADLPPQTPLDRFINYFNDVPKALSTPEFWMVMALFTIAVASIYLLGRGVRRRRVVSKREASTQKALVLIFVLYVF